MAAIVAPFVLASLFPIVDAILLEKRGNSTISEGFEGLTQFGPWTVPFWAYILIIGLITTASISFLVFLVNFLLSISCWMLCSSVNTLLAEKAEQRQEKKAHKTQNPTHTQQPPPQPQPLQHQPTREWQDSPTRGANTGIPNYPHLRTYSTHSNNGAYAMNQARAGSIAPYHQYTLSGGLPGVPNPYPQREQLHQQQLYQNHNQQYQYQRQRQLKRTAPEPFAFPLVPASMLPPKPPPLPSRALSHPSSELDPVGPYPPPGLDHKYSASR